MQSWQLPERIADIIPPKARHLEKMKLSLLSLFHVHGYKVVSPPLIEYTESLLTKIDPGLALKTIQFVDQLSGEQLGIRADITPQITRIDAHLMSQNGGINRLCYAGLIVNAVPQLLTGTREPLQIGAELFGCDQVEGDIEIIDLMIKSLSLLMIDDFVLSLGHVEIFNSLVEEAKLNTEEAFSLLHHLLIKDTQAVELFCHEKNISAQLKKSFSALTKLYGGIEVIEKARNQLIHTPKIEHALNEIEQICSAFSQHQLYIDFSELRKDRYHTGILFGVYADGWANTLAKGGRYNNLGKYFGNPRPATGFSFDLKDFLEVIPYHPESNWIYVESKNIKEAKKIITELRSKNEVVIIDYLHQTPNELNCNRILIKENGQWLVKLCD